ncbi:MAG: N-methyl-L-tryptophan oxidase [Bacteroidota bacterium]
MKQQFDVIIIGIGAMGSATACHLAKRGKKVLGIDRYTPPHSLGSSHGQTRIIREAYFEDPQYVPIVQQAYENWGKLEKEYGHPLYLQTGGLMMGEPGCDIVKGTILSAELHHLQYEIINAKEIKKKFSAFNPSDKTIAVWETRAGIIFPEEGIKAHITVAVKNNADFLFNEPAVSWQASGDGVCVTTSNGKYYADQLLLTAGAWLNNFLPGNELPLTVERQVLYWFEPASKTNAFNPDKFPVFIWTPDNDNDFYGFPDLGTGVKIARPHRSKPADPDTINRNVKEEEIAVIKSLLQKYIPQANGRLLSTEVCMYTNTPDNHFRIFPHPQYQQVLAASICSGHGFKFSSAIGEILSDILLYKKTSFDLSLFGFH